MISNWTYGEPPKSLPQAIALSIANIVMNSIVSYKNLLKTRGDPPRGVYTGGRAQSASGSIKELEKGSRFDEPQTHMSEIRFSSRSRRTKCRASISKIQ